MNFPTFSKMTTPLSSVFAPFTVCQQFEPEWDCFFIVLVDPTNGEKVHLAEFSEADELADYAIELVLNDGREIECTSDADVQRVITEMGIRGQLDDLIQLMRD